MGNLCSSGQTAQQDTNAPAKKVRIPNNANAQEFEELFVQVESTIKILDNKIMVERDKVQEFIDQSLIQSITETDKSQVLIEKTKNDKLEELRKYKSQCEELVKRIEDVKREKDRQKSRLASHGAGDQSQQLTIEDLKEIDEQVKQQNEGLKQIDDEFKKIYMLFLTYKEGSDQIDTYENTLQQLNDEIPIIQKSMQKLKELINEYIKFNDEAIKDNVNYDKKMYPKEEESYKILDKDYQSLMPKVNNLLQTVTLLQAKRLEVNEKKFTDPSFVRAEVVKLMDATSLRELCKKNHDNIKKDLKDKRERYADMQMESIGQTLETRINQLVREIQELHHIYQKKKRDINVTTNFIDQAAILSGSIDEFEKAAAKSAKLKVSPIVDLHQIVIKSKQLITDLLDLEAKVAVEEIDVYQIKLSNKFNKIDERFIILNESKFKLTDDLSGQFEKLKQTYLRIKQKFQEIYSKKREYPNNYNDIFEFKTQSEELSNIARELMHMFLESNLAAQQILGIPLPKLENFACIVDTLMFRFKDMSKTQLIIKKLKPLTYRFGTKQIQAKVNNGILLVRVGGGYMEMDKFYELYGDQELLRQQRELDGESPSDRGSIEPGKKPSVPTQKRKGKIQKGKKAPNMDSSDVAQDQIDLSEDYQPGEYEVTLTDEEEQNFDESMDESQNSMNKSVSKSSSFIGQQSPAGDERSKSQLSNNLTPSTSTKISDEVKSKSSPNPSKFKKTEQPILNQKVSTSLKNKVQTQAATTKGKNTTQKKN